ncbi:MAG: Hg(II)-responsive transcriptional regulator MerR [Myxococcales bacterium]
MNRELQISEVAREAGVNVQTLRYYERRGILAEPGRTASGYRKYPSEAVRLIRFIKRAQDLGFTLSEVEDLLTVRATQKLRDLQRIKSALETLIADCGCNGTALRCPILEALDGSPALEAQHG